MGQPTCLIIAFNTAEFSVGPVLTSWLGVPSIFKQRWRLGDVWPQNVLRQRPSVQRAEVRQNAITTRDCGGKNLICGEQLSPHVGIVAPLAGEKECHLGDSWTKKWTTITSWQRPTAMLQLLIVFAEIAIVTTIRRQHDVAIRPCSVLSACCAARIEVLRNIQRNFLGYSNKGNMPMVFY